MGEVTLDAGWDHLIGVTSQKFLRKKDSKKIMSQKFGDLKSSEPDNVGF